MCKLYNTFLTNHLELDLFDSHYRLLLQTTKLIMNWVFRKKNFRFLEFQHSHPNLWFWSRAATLECGETIKTRKFSTNLGQIFHTVHENMAFQPVNYNQNSIENKIKI